MRFISIAPCHLFDAEAVVALLGKDAPPVECVRSKSCFPEGNCSPDRASVLVAMDGARIVGTVAFTHDPMYSFIYNLSVKEEYRRHGIGTALVEEATKILEEKITHEIGAYILPENEASRALFRKLGWDEYPARPVPVGRKVGR